MYRYSARLFIRQHVAAGNTTKQKKKTHSALRNDRLPRNEQLIRKHRFYYTIPIQLHVFPLTAMSAP